MVKNISDQVINIFTHHDHGHDLGNKMKHFFLSLPTGVCAFVVVVFLFFGVWLLLFQPTGPVPERTLQSSPRLASLVASLTFE